MVLLAGCSNRQETVSKNDAYVIGVVTKSRDSEYWMSVCSGMEKAADEEGVSVLIVSPDTETDAVLQKKMIQDLLDKRWMHWRCLLLIPTVMQIILKKQMRWGYRFLHMTRR